MTNIKHDKHDKYQGYKYEGKSREIYFMTNIEVTNMKQYSWEICYLLHVIVEVFTVAELITVAVRHLQNNWSSASVVSGVREARLFQYR